MISKGRGGWEKHISHNPFPPPQPSTTSCSPNDSPEGEADGRRAGGPATTLPPPPPPKHSRAQTMCFARSLEEVKVWRRRRITSEDRGELTEERLCMRHMSHTYNSTGSKNQSHISVRQLAPAAGRTHNHHACQPPRAPTQSPPHHHDHHC